MPKKIHKLDEKENYEFSLVGISSPENDYRMSWILNSEKGYKLSRLDNLKIWHKKLENPQEFHQFAWLDEETLINYRLISNKSENGALLEEMPNIDYLLQIGGETDDRFLTRLIKELNSLDEISLAFKLDPASLKSRKKLLT